MGNSICYGDGCDRTATRKGLCGKHYDRLRRVGTTTLPSRTTARMMLCSVGGCGRNQLCRGYCNMHYTRFMATGDPGPAEPLKWVTEQDGDDVVSRIMERTVIKESCILWTGYKLHNGYGTIHWRGKEWVVHRAMWTAKVGPIPTDDDWTLDHLCRNRNCVNIAHLEVVTRTENSRRGGGMAIAHKLNKSRYIQRGTCRNGHALTAENAWYSAKGERICKPCKTEARRRQRAKDKAARTR